MMSYADSYHFYTNMPMVLIRLMMKLIPFGI